MAYSFTTSYFRPRVKVGQTAHQTGMDGNIVNPGDLDCRVLPAHEIDTFRDGNEIGALVGPNLVEGVPGFGDAVHDALRDLADRLVAEAVWVELPEAAELWLEPTAAAEAVNPKQRCGTVLSQRK